MAFGAICYCHQRYNWECGTSFNKYLIDLHIKKEYTITYTPTGLTLKTDSMTLVYTDNDFGDKRKIEVQENLIA